MHLFNNIYLKMNLIDVHLILYIQYIVKFSLYIVDEKYSHHLNLHQRFLEYIFYHFTWRVLVET